MGPSPRVRGKPGQWHAEGQRGRLIPARAGKTYRSHEHFTRNRAHPRACGENGRSSSGHARPPWLIPARAGKTSVRLKIVHRLGAHPRACGENALTIVVSAVTVGSSPRVRGKRTPSTRPSSSGGLIPARAGKTVPVRQVPAPHPAHPRACGENELAQDAADGPGGSSPRVRGKPRRGHTPRLRGGLIPARAGKTR